MMDLNQMIVAKEEDMYVCVVCVCDVATERSDVEEGRSNVCDVHDVHDVHDVCYVCYVFDVIVGQREGKNDFVCVSKEREAPRFPIPTVNCVLVAFTLKRIIMARTRSGI